MDWHAVEVHAVADQSPGDLWTGLAYLWTQLRSHRLFWLWGLLINLASLASLAALFYWLLQWRLMQ
jgi:hypothetical protein